MPFIYDLVNVSQFTVQMHVHCYNYLSSFVTCTCVFLSFVILFVCTFQIVVFYFSRNISDSPIGFPAASDY